MRDEYLPFHRPSIGQAEIDEVVDTLRSGWLTTGPKTRQFQEEFATYVGARKAVALSSGTAALHLALVALGIGDGDEVIVPTMAFASAAEVVVHLGARPVLIDCRPDTLNLDESLLEGVLSPRTRAVVPVHMGGHPCDMEQIMDLARTRGVAVVEDAAHALPAAVGDRKIGAIGDVTAFSFYVTKTLTTGEGGMATTQDEELAEKMAVLSLHGMSRDAWKRYTSTGTWRYEIVLPGYKYNMSDIAAAIGIQQLARVEEMRDRRRQIAAAYDRAFADLDAVRTPACLPGVEHAWHLYALSIEPAVLSIDRATFIERLRERNIGTSVHFIPIHLHPYYAQLLGQGRGDFPVAESAYDRAVSLPIYPAMDDRDVEDVVEAVRHVAREFRR